MGEFNIGQSWDDFKDIFNQKLPLAQAWGKMIDSLEAFKPKPYWITLRNIDIEAGRKAIKEWVELTFVEDAITVDTKSLWVGIGEYVDKNDTKLYGLYLIGYDVEDPDDLDGDDPTFLPEENLMIPADLVIIEQTTKQDEDYSFLDWMLPLVYCSLVLDDIIRGDLDKQNILKVNSKIPVAVGYDGGDFMKLSTIE
jgi:hypothetical protein